MSYLVPFEMPHHWTSTDLAAMERRSPPPLQPSQVEAEATSLTRLGQDALDSGRHESAIGYFERAIQLQSHCYSAWYHQGDALAHLKRYAEALTCFERAAAICPDCAEAWTFQAVVLIYLERYAEALSACDRALALNAQDVEAWTFRGVALQRLGRYDQAYASYGAATGVGRRSSWWQLIKQFCNRLMKRIGFLRR